MTSLSADYAASLSLSFGSGQEIVNWESYSFADDFLTPCSGFTLSIGDDKISQDLRDLLVAGQPVTLNMSLGDGSPTRPIATGQIDQLSINTDADKTTIEVRGRNFLGPICDAGISPWDPSVQFSEGQTLSDVMGIVFGDYNVSVFYLTDAANRRITTGVDVSRSKLQTQEVKISTPTNLLSDQPSDTTTTQTVTYYYDPSAPTDLTKLSIKHLKPKPGETAYEFAEQNAKRFHLHIWAMADGSGVVISAPDYLSDPSYTLTNRLDGQNNNVLRGSVSFDYVNQPSAIIAKGTSGAGDFKTTRIKTAKVNELLGYFDTSNPFANVTKVINKYKGLHVQAPNTDLITRYSKYFTAPDIPRIVYYEDDKPGTTLSQLESAVSRKMSEYQRHALKYHATVQDHHQQGIVYKVNTIVSVNDEVCGVNDNFWIESVSFHKSSSGGTLTDLVCIPIGVISL